jgi:hypothetical protein
MRPSLRKAVAITMLILSCSIFHQPLHAQHIILGNEKFKIEAGLNFGPTFFLGDLGGNRGKGSTFVKDVNLELTRMMKGAFISIYPNQWIGLRVAAQYTYIAGQDNLISTKGVNEMYRKARNLDFKSHMWEAYTAIELLPTMIFNKYDDYEPRLKPYGFVGIGLFHFDPQGSITDANGTQTWYKLHPLHTEGQGFPEYPKVKNYNLTQVNIPMGGGIKYDLSNKVTLATELLYRKTFTDYIDDVSTTYIDPYYFTKYLSASDAAIEIKIHDKTISSLSPGVNKRVSPGDQRGNVNNNDAYFSFVLKLGIKLGPDNSEEGRQMRQTKCPHFY